MTGFIESVKIEELVPEQFKVELGYLIDKHKGIEDVIKLCVTEYVSNMTLSLDEKLEYLKKIGDYKSAFELMESEYKSLKETSVTPVESTEETCEVVVQEPVKEPKEETQKEPKKKTESKHKHKKVRYYLTNEAENEIKDFIVKLNYEFTIPMILNKFAHKFNGITDYHIERVLKPLMESGAVSCHLSDSYPRTRWFKNETKTIKADPEAVITPVKDDMRLKWRPEVEHTPVIPLISGKDLMQDDDICDALMLNIYERMVKNLEPMGIWDAHDVVVKAKPELKEKYSSAAIKNAAVEMLETMCNRAGKYGVLLQKTSANTYKGCHGGKNPKLGVKAYIKARGLKL